MPGAARFQQPLADPHPNAHAHPDAVAVADAHAIRLRLGLFDRFGVCREPKQRPEQDGLGITLRVRREPGVRHALRVGRAIAAGVGLSVVVPDLRYSHRLRIAHRLCRREREYERQRELD